MEGLLKLHFIVQGQLLIKIYKVFKPACGRQGCGGQVYFNLLFWGLYLTSGIEYATLHSESSLQSHSFEITRCVSLLRCVAITKGDVL